MQNKPVDPANQATPFFPTTDSQFEDMGSLSSVPGNVSHLSQTPNEECPKGRIQFHYAREVCHAKISNYQPPSYYKDYIMTTTHSPQMQAQQAAQAKRLGELCAGSNGSLVEVGCGDGSFLLHCKKHFSSVLGIEPSARFAAKAREAGVEVLDGYVTLETPLTEKKFNAFASRQVFEHLPDPLGVLRAIRHMLKPGAVGLIEVPNGFRALNLARYFEFFPDHVQYYSANSLVGLATAAGLNVIECRESFGGDYLELWMRLVDDPHKKFFALQREREKIVSKLGEVVTTSKGPVAIWGAGAKTLSTLSSTPPEILQRIIHVIDSDPYKHSRFIPNTSIKVVTPEEASSVPCDTIIILALSYREEIAASIRAKIKNCKHILTFDNNNQLLEI